jgi:hypothetical protein
MFCNCNLRVFKNSQVRAFLQYNHWCFQFNGSLVDFPDTAFHFIGKKLQNAIQLHCSIVATGTGQIQRFQICFRERRPERGYMSVVHSFQHGVLSCLQNIRVLWAEGHLISAGVKILSGWWVDIYLQLCAGWKHYWVTAIWSWIVETVSASSVMDTEVLLPCSQEPAGGSVLSLMNEIHKIGKLYSLEYTDIPKVFFTPRHAGYWCSNVIRG